MDLDEDDNQDDFEDEGDDDAVLNEEMDMEETKQEAVAD